MYYYDPAFPGPPFMFPGALPQSPPGLPLPYAHEQSRIAAHSQLHPQAPPFIPSALTAKALPRLSVPSESPSPALSIDPLAQALRRTMPKIRNPHRAGPGERRPQPEIMEPSNISDKFLYVEGVPPNAPGDDLKAAFESLGQFRGIFVRLLSEHGVVILAFHDSRHASQALSKIQSNPQQYFEGSTLSARIPSYPELKQILGDSPVLLDSDSRVYVTLVGRTTILGPQMQGLLSTFGDLKHFRVVGMHYKRFHVEFFDSRDSARAVQSLNNHKLHGAIAHLSSDSDSNVVPSSHSSSTAEDPELTSVLQTTEVRGPADEHAYIEGVPFPSDGHEDTPTTPNSSEIFDHRTRYGRRASTGSAFPSSSPRSASSTDNLPPSAHSPGVPFPTYPDDHSPQELPQELRRRRSVAHSFDSASASSATSLSFKFFGSSSGLARESTTTLASISSDRTVSTAPSTPAGLGRRMSLPPYQALPPPSKNQWTPVAIDRDEDEPADEVEGFIQVRGNASSRPSGGLGGSAAHMCLPASARAVLDLLRDPPPERNRVDIARIEAGLDTRTTIMLKNIPNKMSTKNLIDFIEVVTPRAIDFLYLRFDFQNECNVGYAFVNFINISDLLTFMKAKLGRKWNMYASEKVLNAGYANYQGKEALIEKFKNSSIMNAK
ncbi:Meiosis protein mei2 OS=Schizosaccharomyces pombe (strain 972 / ATCC 24843) GN=mei2 PE=1 SV=1 [Rhizoctonia solani AG-1 IB]|uniref:Meiosis protein mei2 n=1 Tax=Thanatephorus cucumeris (strain AG1-IB / isolate 7/3/14) TaxID=1108050 RepID=A0A0B7FWT2_THACB|nr:Meiosis protein mei2 OS=Schizosaccharomyces pombe (strain 972 / ATCC 24843) GN=mei2 PE=1 SV=1 [Rhizoctonia solani AG-1 IB]